MKRWPRKHPFIFALRRWGRFAQNVPGGQERGCFRGQHAAYWRFYSNMNIIKCALVFFWLCSSCKPTILKKPQPITNVIVVGTNHSHYSV